MKRNSYLIDKSLNYYLMASIITMAVMNLNGMIDGILMGRLIGPKALSAINVSMPVINCIAALDVILSNGASSIISKALGQNKQDTVNATFTVSCLSVVLGGILIALLSPMLTRFFAGVLCVDQTLLPLCGDYIRVLFLSSVFLMLQNSLSMFADVFGNPKIVTLSMSASVVINLLFDVFLVGVLRMNIRGAAYATVLGAIVSIIVFICYFYKQRKAFHLKFCLKKWRSVLSDNISNGIPLALSTVSTMLLALICNYFIQYAQGADGMFVMSVGYSFISLGSMIANGIGMSFIAIGGMFAGQRDRDGLRFLYRRGMRISVAAGMLLLLINAIFPGPLATLFGAKEQALIELAKSSLPLVGTFVIALSVVLPTSVLYQVLDHLKLSMIASVALMVSALAGFAISVYLIGAQAVWLAFPIAAVLAITILLISSQIVRRRSPVQLRFLSLIACEENDADSCLSISVECVQESVNNAYDQVLDFIRKSNLGEVGNRVHHCTEELMLNILQHSGRGKEQYFDLILSLSDEEVTEIIRDNGRPFSPLNYAVGKTAGLPIVGGFCDQHSYSYSYGLNISVLKWKRNTARKED